MATDLPEEVAFEVDTRKSFQHRTANREQAGWRTNIPFIKAKLVGQKKPTSLRLK